MTLAKHVDASAARRAAAKPPSPVIIVGAGIGGLCAAIDLARAGLPVTVLERAPTVGGKVREVAVGTRTVDAGPTMLTMRWVLDTLFADAGTSLDAHVTLEKLTTLGRHAWAGEQRLDLFADLDRSADAIGRFAGAKDAAGFRAFSQQARRVYATLESRFIKAPLPTGTRLMLSAGPIGLHRLKPFTTLWDEVGSFMRDPRLRQLFSRTSTDLGTSPFQAPAAAMMLSHVEQVGLFTVTGGMQRLVEAMADLATRLGATIRTEAAVREITAANGAATGVRLESGEAIRGRAVIMNGEPSALGAGLLGRGVTRASPVVKFPQRTLSANSWAVVAEATGLDLLRRTVCFSRDTKQEFDLINTGLLPTEPTITIIAPDRAANHASDRASDRPADRTPPHAAAAPSPAPRTPVLDRRATPSPDHPSGPERLLLAVNAPASGDRRAFSQVEIDQCMGGMTNLMNRCGLELRLAEAPVMTTPATLHRLFPASGGALYGQALTGAAAALQRPGARSKVKALYLTGGGTHPGPGLPLTVLSGRLAAAAVLEDLAPARSVFSRLLKRK